MRDNKATGAAPDRSRRAFVLVLPLMAIGGMLATVAIAAFRFLSPTVSASSEKWIDVAQVTELVGNKPLPRKIAVEEVAGWARSFAEHSVYILPGKNSQVLSAVCPHEGCEVSWHDDGNVFSCPCHDSNFAADGSRIYGPARRGLDPLPSRVVDGKLQVQYQSFINNTQERTSRG
ncbi:MAG TPA: ubiquinol-cytochrome c reductase iron-sulfur subunit [Pyrinomonadaceae bacterium]|jgi:quinol---cytochrome c reductase iron-sulfur subunit, bacillus type